MIYDERNVGAIDKFVSPELSIFDSMTNRSKLKEDIKKLLDLFPDLEHDLKHIIAEGESISVFDKWKSSKGNSIVAYFLRIENRQITKWDQIPKEYNRYLRKNFEKLCKDILRCSSL
jgi:hypothetical protein